MSAAAERPEFVIFGTTTAAQEDALPMRLSPVYLRLRDGALFLPRDEEATNLEQLEPVEASWVEEQQAQGGLITFDPPLATHPGSWLLQLTAEEPPILLEPEEARRQLHEAGERALEDVQQAIGHADHARAERQAWYASRALPQDPRPLITLVWLLRRTGLDEEHIVHLEEDLQSFPDEARSQAQALLERWIQAPPSRPSRQSRVPTYLAGIDDDPSFLDKARSLFWSTKLVPT